MAKVGRYVMARGSWYTICCAVLADGTSPARQFLDDLAAGNWMEGIKRLFDKPENQIDERAQFLARMKAFAESGELEGRHQINCLSQGIWEFKVASKRLSFYDTDGAGGFEPKVCLRDKAAAPDPSSPTWFVPDLDEDLRLAGGFVKPGQTTPRKNIDWAVRIRKEDLEHDRQRTDAD